MLCTAVILFLLHQPQTLEKSSSSEISETRLVHLPDGGISGVKLVNISASSHICAMGCAKHVAYSLVVSATRKTEAIYQIISDHLGITNPMSSFLKKGEFQYVKISTALTCRYKSLYSSIYGCKAMQQQITELLQ